jgi:hypothetical protein
MASPAAGADERGGEQQRAERRRVQPERCGAPVGADDQARERRTGDGGDREQALLQGEDPADLLVPHDPRDQRSPGGVGHGLPALQHHDQQVRRPAAGHQRQPGAGQDLGAGRDEQHPAGVAAVGERAGHTHHQHGRQGEGGHQQRDADGAPARVVHPQGQRDDRQRVPDVRHGAGRDHQTEVAMPPEGRLPRAIMKGLFHTS